MQADLRFKRNEGNSKASVLEADTFTLEVELNKAILVVSLKDYVEWKSYAKKYTAEDIGKQISNKVQLEDVFHALTDINSKDLNDIENQSKLNFFSYTFRNIIKLNNSGSFRIDKDGKLTIDHKIFYMRNGQMVEKIQSSKLILVKVAQISGQEKINVIKQIAEKKAQEKYKKQNSKLKQQNEELKKKLEQMEKKFDQKNNIKLKKIESDTQKFTVFIKTIPLRVHQIFQLSVCLKNNVLQVKQMIKQKLGLNRLNFRLQYNGKELSDRITLLDYNVQINSTLNLIIN